MKPHTTPTPRGAGRASALPCALALSVSTLLQAQSLPPPTTPTKSDGDPKAVVLEAVSVTGSNIRRLDVEKVLPVTVITRDVMEARSAITPADLLTSLPQVTGLPLNETTQGSAGARGDISSINLRGIGTSNSLLLLNGRRLASHPTSGALNYTVNASQLPTQGIAQIEVLRDSASSIYGSDAVAGVVNYVMRRDFRGTELKVRYGLPDEPGGSSVQTTLTYGFDFAGGRGRVLSTFDFLYRDAIYLRDRSFTANADHTADAPAPFNAVGGSFDGRSAVSFWPQFRVGASTATTYFRPVNGVPTLTAVAPTRAANPEYYVNINQFFIGSPRTDRVNSFNSIEYDLKNGITAFADISFYHAYSATQRTPISLNAPTTNRLAPLAVDNPYNPYGSRFYSPTGAPNADGTPRLVGTPTSTTLAVELVNSLLPDQTNVTSNVHRVVAGLRGKLGQTWSWEAAALESRASAVDKSPNYVRESLFDKALLKTDSTAFNPFGYTFKVQNGAVVADQPYKNPDSVMSTFTWPFRRDGRSAIEGVDARASGSLFSMWSGDVSLAVGAEYRKEKFSDLRPQYISINPPNEPGLDPTTNDVLQFPPAPDSAGKRNITSFYTETVIPLAAPRNNIPLVNSLELSASARYEKYSDFGKTTKPKVGLNWKPVTSVMLRGSYSEGFTAPSLPMLYAPSQYNTSALPGITDAYRNPVTNEGPYVIRTYSFGNPALKPAVSRGKSAGLVLDVPGIRGLSASADYWDISQSDVIGSRSSQLIFDTDALLLKAYTAQQLAAGVPLASINLGSGTAAYKGDPAVVRYPVAAADTAAFARSTNAAVVGQILSISTPYLNLSKGYASGWDFSLNYASPKLPFGRFDLNTEWAYLRRSFTVQASAAGAPIVTERVNVGGASRWRGSSTLAWRKGEWGAGISAYYIGPFADTGATTTQALYESLGRPSYIIRQYTTGNFFYYYRVRDTLTYNLFASYRFSAQAAKWLRSSSVRLGVVNAFDTPPPLTSGATGYSTSAYQNLLVGRTWTLELTKRF